MEQWARLREGLREQVRGTGPAFLDRLAHLSPGTEAPPATDLPDPQGRKEFGEDRPAGDEKTDPANSLGSQRGETSAALPAVPSYKLLEELGRGGMGVVYKARQLSLNRPVALKMILGGPHASAADLARFCQEAEAARLQHPNIVQIHEIGWHDALPFFSLEFVDGGSLSERLGGVPQPARPSAELVETLARAVHFAHRKGIIHRDLKPANILLQQNTTTDDTDDIDGKKKPYSSSVLSVVGFLPKITDFGLAKRLDGSPGQTKTGVVVGTPSYMSPEQAGAPGKVVGPAADVWALGAILYESLTGRPPFRAETALETLVQVVHQEPVPPARLQPGVPLDLQTVCLKCLEKEPGQRYASALDLAEDLRRFLAGEPVVARPSGVAERMIKWARRRPAIAALLAVVVFVAGTSAALVLWQQHEALHQGKLADERGTAETKAREGEEEQSRLAEKREREARTARYAKLLAEADTAHGRSQVREALELLDRCPEDLRAWEWHYLKRRFEGDALALRGHTSPIHGVAFSPDGRRPATAARDQSVKVWDLATGKEVFTCKGHKGFVHTVAFSPDGKRLVAAGDARTVRVWVVGSGP